MGPRDFAQRVDLVDADVDVLLGDEVEEFGGIRIDLLARNDVVEERGAQELRVLSRQAGEGERGHGARCVAERDHAALAREALEREVEGSLTDPVEHGCDPLAAGELQHLRFDVLVAVVDDVRGARLGR